MEMAPERAAPFHADMKAAGQDKKFREEDYKTQES